MEVGGTHRLSLPHLNLVGFGIRSLAVQSFRARLVVLELFEVFGDTVAAFVHLRQVGARVHVAAEARLLGQSERPGEIDADTRFAGDVVGAELLAASDVVVTMATDFEQGRRFDEIGAREFACVVHQGTVGASRRVALFAGCVKRTND